jgi:predicted phage terminase large subunit-like protein
MSSLQSPLSPAQAALEVLKRDDARRDLTAFIDYISELEGGIKPARHHQLLIEKLEAVERGEIKRLMVFMPPGSAKSTYANRIFSAWYMGRNPGKLMITASHSAELAEYFGKKARKIAGSPEFRAVFETGLDPGNSAADQWALESGSEYLATSVGGSITGRRADGCIIDDPVKGREEADSETIRRKTLEWYRSDVWTRLKPGAFVILIMTRWHELDLAGCLLADMVAGGEQWEVLSIPAIAMEDDPLGRAKGEPLWQEWFTPEMFEEARRDKRKWSSLYQQQPAPDDGDYFQRDWIRWYSKDQTPRHMRIYGASDYATKEGKGDYTVHGVFGVDPNDDIYVLDWWREQTTSDVWIETFLDLMKQYEPIAWAEEKGQIMAALGPFIDKRQRERRIYGHRVQYASAADKPTRARSIQARMAMRKVYFPADAPWVDSLVTEMLQFPVGKNDDQVDVLSMVGRMLNDMARGSVPAEPEKPKFIQDATLNDLWRNQPRRSAYGRI